MKSTVDEIRRRFDADVDRFSDLEIGQAATVDAPLAMALVAEAAAATGASGPKDMGKVMGWLMPKVKGKADGSAVNQAVKKRLG